MNRTMMLMLVLGGVSCAHPPLVIPGQRECWQPAPTGSPFDVTTHAVLTHHANHYVLQRCLWRPYGGLANAWMKLMQIDTIIADSVELWNPSLR